MILVSLFSEENVLSDDIKIYAIFLHIKVTKFERSAFFGTPCISEMRGPTGYQYISYGVKLKLFWLKNNFLFVNVIKRYLFLENSLLI